MVKKHLIQSTLRMVKRPLPEYQQLTTTATRHKNWIILLLQGLVTAPLINMMSNYILQTAQNDYLNYLIIFFIRYLYNNNIYYYIN
jgi:hypothetical protein